VQQGQLGGVVGSGQSDIKQTATAAWKAENAQSRMDALLTSTYGSKSLDGVLSPNDTLARAIITSVKAAGRPIPVVTGQDSEAESRRTMGAPAFEVICTAATRSSTSAGTTTRSATTR
jgi:putative multiple sugar transport system substrate-binding protein